jgi:MFS family permease
LVGALIFGVIGPRLPKHLTFAVAFVLVGLPMWVLALQPPFFLTLLAFVVIGLASGPINPIIGTVVLQRIPRSMRGRVNGTLTAGAFVAMPLGMLIAGFVSQQFGVITAIVLIAAAYLVVTLSIFVNPAMREMDRIPSPAAPAAPTTPAA